jgi:hypothetical protein
MGGRANRREVLLGAVALATGLARAASAGSGASAASAVAGSVDAHSRSHARVDHWVVLHDAAVAAPLEALREFHVAPATCIALDADPVRMWRGSQAPLLADRNTRLSGATTWPQFLMVRGLAEESGRRVRAQRFDRTRSIVTWLIA